MNTEYTFFDNVYAIVRQIPSGRITSYGAIAKYLGSGRGARMVGWAMNQSHSQAISVPAHRVVNRAGVLTGKNHFKSPTAMQAALEKEGIQVQNDKVVNFVEHFWNPAVELQP